MFVARTVKSTLQQLPTLTAVIGAWNKPNGGQEVRNGECLRHRRLDINAPLTESLFVSIGVVN